jgi:hypothetical protein
MLRVENAAEVQQIIGAIKEQIPLQAQKVQKVLSLGVLRSLVLATPVDTGRARANWITRNGGYSGAVLDVTFGRGAASAAASHALNAGKANVESIQPFSFFGIDNNVPYMVSLNQGTSQQAPTMFIDIIIAAWGAKLAGSGVITEVL